MNYRTMLLASAAVLFATSASAQDITSPFYLPGQGQLLSKTSVDYNRTTTKHHQGTSEALYGQEEITYGVTDNMSVVAAIGNQFDVKRMTNREYNNDHNFDYTLGAKYNMNYGSWMSQIGASYYTYDPNSWYGHRNEDEDWKKEISAEVKLGYDLCNGLVPYTSFKATSVVDETNRTMDYSWFAGIHKSAPKYSLDAGIRYDFNTDNDNSNDGKHNTNEWYAQAEANYFLKDNIALGVYGDYYLGGSFNDEVDYDYTAGVQAKVLF